MVLTKRFDKLETGESIEFGIQKTHIIFLKQVKIITHVLVEDTHFVSDYSVPNILKRCTLTH